MQRRSQLTWGGPRLQAQGLLSWWTGRYVWSLAGIDCLQKGLQSQKCTSVHSSSMYHSPHHSRHWDGCCLSESCCQGFKCEDGNACVIPAYHCDSVCQQPLQRADGLHISQHPHTQTIHMEPAKSSRSIDAPVSDVIHKPHRSAPSFHPAPGFPLLCLLPSSSCRHTTAAPSHALLPGRNAAFDDT